MRITPDMKEHNLRYSPHRYRITLLQTNPRCEICGNPTVEVHHKDKNKHNNCFGNLMAVCHSCHHRLHKGVMRSKVYRTYGKTALEISRDFNISVGMVYDRMERSIPFERKGNYNWLRNRRIKDENTQKKKTKLLDVCLSDMEKSTTV